MPKYRVKVAELWYSHRIVEAADEDNALLLADSAEEVYREYSHMPETEDPWECELEHE